MRITINSVNLALFTKRYVHPKLWDVDAKKCKGKSSESMEINNYLDSYKNNVYNKYTDLLKSYEEVTPELLRDAILCVNSAKARTLCSIWEEHVEELRLLIGKESSYANFQKYRAALKYMVEFLQKDYKTKDIPIKYVDRNMVQKFEMFLKIRKNLCHNTTMKYLQNFKRIVLIALKNGWLVVNPFIDFKLGLREVDSTYLTEAEMQKIMSLDIQIDRLDLVRDLFVFSCFSGLAYSDLYKLKRSEIELNPDGTLWIKTRRQKTKVKAQIPLLEVPKLIIEKYVDLETLKAEDKILPVLSNQKLNAYLKEIQTLSGLEKNLTFHVARHTFATTVTMMHGVPIESVSRMLGHTNIKTTQHYARIVDAKIGSDMALLAGKLGGRYIMATANA
jgi:site-specific recombinase XerD